MTKLECKKTLRTLELDAYSSIVAVFRAQGELNEKKMEILQDLQIMLHITIDRHKAELRRVVNDEKLYTIAKRLSSSNTNTNTKWLLESKRSVPVLPRLPPSTYYKLLADQLVEKSKGYVDALAIPSDTEFKHNNDTQPELAQTDPNTGYLNDDLSVNFNNSLGI